MKKTNYIKILITLVFYTTVAGLQPVYAWDDCPKGVVNDPYPGDCARYIDTDNNGICDHSEPAPEDRVKEVQGISEKTRLADSVEVPTSNPNPDNTPQSKPFLAFGIVITHLAGILIYVTYRKIRLQKGAR